MRAGWKWTVLSLLLVPLWMAAAAPKPEAEEADAPKVERGPAKVELGHELLLDLPEDYLFVEKASAKKFLEANGSFHNDNLLGLVVGNDRELPWFVVIRYQDEGYIKDDEKLDAKEILDAIKEGQEEANQERKQRGFKELRVGGWSEEPHYDRAKHHLVWALNAVTDDDTTVNYNTRVLGRRGYVSLNLVVDPVMLEKSKPHAAALLQHTSFKAGSRYEDFQEGTDKVAEYGLAGLVLGGAGVAALKLVKVGLLAKAGKFLIALLVAGKKGIVLVLAGIGAFLKKLFGKKSDEPSNTP